LSTPASQAQWFGHPRGLSTLFFTEMWERFSYYGMRGLLVLFLTNAVATGGFGLDDQTAAAIYGLYTAGVYLLALPGGWVADRLIGQRRAVFYGGILIAAGHFSMALASTVTFFGGLLLIVLGTGLLKPNVSAVVGDLYPEKGARRDAGFSIFYMGINIGAFTGPLVCGYLGENVDWHLGFGAAGVGMVAGLIQYSLGRPYLGGAGELAPERQADVPRAWRQFGLGVGVTLAFVALLAGLQSAGTIHLTLPEAARWTGVVIVSIAIVYFAAILLFGGLAGDERKRVGAVFVFFLASALFWAGFEQAGSSLNLFAERLTRRVFFDWEMPASWLQSVQPFFVIALAPLFGALWAWLSNRQREPSTPAKFAWGLMLLGVGFLVLAWGATYTVDGSRVSVNWLLSTYFLHTVGELCLSPVGLSVVTKLSPQKLVGQMMGIWFMGTALGNLIAGLAAGFMETLPVSQLFGTVALFTAGSGLILALFSGPLRRLMSGIH
jgi:POT family proton-dependent oligopeptide transporter